MRQLVIDDLRIAKFDAVYARDFDTACEKLVDGHWDQVWLDNDLDDYAEREGYDLVKELERMYFEDNTTVDVDFFFIHTSNPIAKLRMAMTFKNLPYGYQVVDARDHFKGVIR
jgi:hypothetical protein